MKPFLGWLALAAAGQAALLSFVDAGPLIHFQHYRFTAKASVWAIAVIAVQFALAVRAWPRLPRAPIAIGAVLAAVPSPDPSVYAFEALLAAAAVIVNLANFWMLARAIPQSLRDTANRLLDSRLLVPAAALWCFAVPAVLSAVSYQKHPHVSDEVSILFQARYFAEGLWYMPMPPAAEAFKMDLMTQRADRWYSPFPPGWPALLSLGVRTGVPWLMNPLLNALNLLLASQLLRRLFEPRTAALATLLFALSPWALFLAMSYMTHTFSLTCGLAAALCAARSRESGSFVWAMLAGLSVGVATWIRPLEGAVAAVLLFAWLFGARRLAAIAMAISGAAAASVQLAYNAHITGNARTFPVMEYFDLSYSPPGRNALGFGPTRGFNWPIDVWPGHSPAEALLNSFANAITLNTELLGWAMGSLVLLGTLRRLERAEWWMIAVCAGSVISQAFYWYGSGPDFGPRYWFPIVIPMSVLVARALRDLDAVPAGLALSAVAMLLFVPWRAADKYRGYLRMVPDVPALAATHGFGNALVFIRGDEYPDYASAGVYNPIGLGEGPVYVREGSAEREAALRAAFPKRPVWRLEGPTVTGGGYRIVEGPK